MEVSSWVMSAICPCRRQKKECQISEKMDSNAGESTPTAEQATITPQVSVVTQKMPLDSTNEEEEPIIEMPPPMQIQDHSFKPEGKEVSTDDVTAQLVSQLSLKPQGESNQLENMVKQRIDPSIELESAHSSKTELNPGTKAELSQADEMLNPVETPRIEDEEDEVRGDSENRDVEAEKAKFLKKRQFVVQELFDTEKDYVKDLATIVDGYMAYMRDNPLPAEMEGKDKIVFGNIHQIYDWHKETMLSELESCLTNPNKVASIFIRYERRLYMYVKYCENKPKSEYVVSEYLDTYFEEVRQKIGHRLMLPDFLIKPVQRIMRYQLLLKDILKYTEKAGEDISDLKKALTVMCIVPKAANDMMQVGRLQGFDGKITGQGKLLLQDTLSVAEVTSAGQQKFKERRVFLFEQMIIFSEMIERKKGMFSNATYIFKNSLNVNKMSLICNVDGEPLRFQLTDRTPGSDVRMIIQANSEENKETWVRQIQSILDMQKNFLSALQSPIAYQKELSKELSAPEFNNSTIGDSALRKTQSHPINRVHNLSPSKATFKSHSDVSVGIPKLKTDRCKSIPGQFPQSLVESGGGSDGGSGDYSDNKASCPNSPMETSRDFLRNIVTDGNLRKYSAPAVESNSGSSSPKPKKTIFDGFRNTLGRKSKSNDNSKSLSDSFSTSLPQSPTTSMETPILFALEGGNNAEASTATSESFGEATSAAAASSTSTTTVVAAQAATTSLSPSTSSSRVSGRNVSW